MRNGGVTREHCGLEVYVELLLPHRPRRFLDGLASVEATSDVDEDVETAVLFGDARAESNDRILVDEIELGSGGRDHRGAACAQQLHHRLAESAGASGHQRHLARERLHW